MVDIQDFVALVLWASYSSAGLAHKKLLQRNLVALGPNWNWYLPQASGKSLSTRQWGPGTIALSPGGATVKGTGSLDRPTGFTLWKRRRESSAFILIQWKCRSVVCLDVLKWVRSTCILPGDEVFFSSRHAHIPSSQLLSQLGNGPWLIFICTKQIRSSWRNGERQ